MEKVRARQKDRHEILAKPAFLGQDGRWEWLETEGWGLILGGPKVPLLRHWGSWGSFRENDSAQMSFKTSGAIVWEMDMRGWGTVGRLWEEVGAEGQPEPGAVEGIEGRPPLEKATKGITQCRVLV